MDSATDLLFESLMSYRRHSQTIVSVNTIEAKEGEYAPLPEAMDERIAKILNENGIERIYVHQAEGLRRVLAGENVVLSTGVASGKSLVYQLPILCSALADRRNRALLLYPTKALAQDQHLKLSEYLQLLKRDLKVEIKAELYDGDTPAANRSAIRKNAGIVFSNPDMLHLGILPNHSLWSGFFAGLKYVVIDELHYYRGVFGSHFANVIRRLKRILALYRVRPVFICTSATLRNAKELAEELLGEDVALIDTDTSPKGERKNLIVNPPVVNQLLGIRRSALRESAQLARLALKLPLQSIMFSITRRSVETLLQYIPREERGRVHSYRSGYLASTRRAVERDLREGWLKLIISTNALELGIDIGGLDLAIINGYPGSIAAVRQQAGRAGRQGRKAMSIMVAAAGPLDQYICRHPEYLWENNPEYALIDPDNSEIILQALLCAVSELAFREGESFGKMDFVEVEGYLQVLLDEGKIRKVGSKYLGLMGSAPHQEVRLRNCSAQYPIISEGQSIGFVDYSSVHWMAHPKAIYLHEGESYFVEKLDFEEEVIRVKPVDADYFTQAMVSSQLNLQRLCDAKGYGWGKKHFGRVKAIQQVTGFKKIRISDMQLLGMQDLDMPVVELDTVAWWITLSAQLVEEVEKEGWWNNEVNDYGKGWKKLAESIRERDGYSCTNCGAKEGETAFSVHHIRPFKDFEDKELANERGNLTTLCPRCHHLAEQGVRIQSGLAGLGYLLHNLAPFFVMCDPRDLELHISQDQGLAGAKYSLALYDKVPGGIGLCKKLYEIQDEVIRAALEQVENCGCAEGCPACTGAVAEQGKGAKLQAKAILKQMISLK